jgi:hypothetical protein
VYLCRRVSCLESPDSSPLNRRVQAVFAVRLRWCSTWKASPFCAPVSRRQDLACWRGRHHLTFATSTECRLAGERLSWPRRFLVTEGAVILITPTLFRRKLHQRSAGRLAVVGPPKCTPRSQNHIDVDLLNKHTICRIILLPCNSSSSP